MNPGTDKGGCALIYAMKVKPEFGNQHDKPYQSLFFTSSQSKECGIGKQTMEGGGESPVIERDRVQEEQRHIDTKNQQ